MAFINRIEISHFRGIQNLGVSGFSDINIIVGDNNSGKTSFLEAIQLLFAKANLGAVKKVITQRTMLSANSNFYTSFIKMFNQQQSDDELNVDIFAESNVGPLEFELRGTERIASGEEAVRLSSAIGRKKYPYERANKPIPETAKIFQGSIVSQIGKKTAVQDILVTSLEDRISTLILKKEVHYIPSFGHLRFDLLQNIVENPEYKDLVINILRQFDKTIADICYTKADDGTFLESIITQDGAIMPFSVYGDGIKKILFILNKLFASTDKILLIDEIETGLHKKYYDILFPVIFTMAKKLNVQLFIATHSIEAIDAILGYGCYDDFANENEPIKVITLKKIYNDNGSNVVARNVTGKYVYENRKAFKFEVRL